jgi:hypothetical protein
MYCERCRIAFSGGGRCPVCGSKKLRLPQKEDFCFLTETDPMFGGMLKDVLEKNGIPVLSSSTLGAGMALRIGSILEHIRYYVPYGRLPEANELVEALFQAPAGDDAEEDGAPE